MRSRFGGLTFCGLAVTGLLALSIASPALAQPAKPAKPVAGAAAKPAAKPAVAAKSAKPAAVAAKPKLTEKQKKEKAKKDFKDAEAKFDKKDYAAALVLYTEADELFPGPRPKYKIAVCTDRLGGRIQDSAAAYQAFLDANPDAAKQQADITDASARLAAIKATPAKIHVVTFPASLPNLKLAVDGAPQQGPDLSVAPGKHTLSATADGYDPASAVLDVTFAEARETTLTLSLAPPPPAVAVAVVAPPPLAPVALPPPSQPPPPRSNVPAYVTLGLAGAGAIVGTIFGAAALSAKSTYNKNPTTTQADTTDRDALISDMSFAVALTFGVTGTVLLLSDDKAEAKASAPPPPKAPKAALHILPYAGPHGGGASATLKF